jgi:hypothetical protein
MAQETAKVHPINEAAQQAAQPTSQQVARPTKSKPTQPLPADRIVFPKQLGLLRAYAAASGHEKKAVKLPEIADIAKINANTISIANGFFIGVGLIQKTDAGFIPSAEVMAFAAAHEWSADKAAQKLAPIIAESWFAKTLLPKLAFDKVREADAVADLAQAAGAGPEYKNQVKLVVDYMEAAGLLQREGDFLRKSSTAVNNIPPQPAERHAATQPTEQREGLHRDTAPARSGVSSAFTQMTGGMVQFNISVKVDMQEFSGWQPERITAFFAGLAQVLAAKGAVEQRSSGE